MAVIGIMSAMRFIREVASPYNLAIQSQWLRSCQRS
jgi:hypothetical protein